ncbi:MAG: hypothetical protein H8E34_09825 [Bacteroidetes bacterium]|nr:hypothetical protein [Bacteroidota bacterium]MBL6942764.1 hypothetical protein [Bacteroidales bacterium]
MKTKYIIFSLFILAITFSSCRELTISTVVNKDGSFTRIVTITGDSADVFKPPNLPYSVDKTWEREVAKDTAKDNNYILTYTKYYKNSDLINKEMSLDTGWRKKINRTINVGENFVFFYSYMHYTETIKASNPFTLLDYNDYITKEDLLWLGGRKIAVSSSDSAKISQAEDKAVAYLQEAITEEIIHAFKIGIEQLDIPAINPDLAENYRDSIAKKVDDWKFNSTLDFVDDLAIWTDNDDVYKLKEIDRIEFMKLDSKIQFIEKMLDNEDYKVLVEMPGLLTETNSPSTNGNIVSWNVNTYSFLFEDITMEVESRVINKWMFIIAGIILFALIVLTIFKSRK